MKVSKLSIAKDFGRYPGGRFKSGGPYSGEALCELMSHKLTQADKLIVDVDGMVGCCSSFVEAAFGGLVRAAGDIGLNKQQVISRIEIVAKDDPILKQEAMQYMLDVPG